MTTARTRPLAKIKRLTNSSDFGRVYASGESVPDKLLVLWCCERAEAGPARVGVVASKRALGKAHDRNRAKRLLREACRNRADLFCEGADYVLIARRNISAAKCQDVERGLARAMKRLK